MKSESTARSLTDQDIHNIVAAGSTINCECPKHLADLIFKLTAFEKYSSECEVRNAKDAELHKELETTSAKSRFLIEEVLIKLAKVEGNKVLAKKMKSLVLFLMILDSMIMMP